MTIFILSHNRASNIDTLLMLERYGYNGDWYVVISDDDEQLSDYKSRVASEHLLVFNKLEIKNNIDTMYYSDKFVSKASVYARNYILRVAREMNLDYFIMADDDIQKIYHRENVDGKMKQLEINNINPILDAMQVFMECSPRICSLCPALDDAFFGGVNGNFSKGMTRQSFQFFMVNARNARNFVGIRFEDFTWSFINKDQLFLAYWHLSFKSPKMASNRGGIDYNQTKNPHLWGLVIEPSAIKLTIDGRKRMAINSIYPMIVSDDFKKK